MSSIIEHINKAFENRVRLGIMSILSVNDGMDFNNLKELLQVTDGNLSSHLQALEKLEYIKIVKSFIGKKPNTTYFITKLGTKAFTDHINGLEAMIKKMK